LADETPFSQRKDEVMEKEPRKLTLTQETLRKLRGAELRVVAAGGGGAVSDPVTNPGQGCPAPQ